jgi:hypothetical protein
MYSISDMKKDLTAFFSNNKYITVKHDIGRALIVRYPRRGQVRFRLFKTHLETKSALHDNSAKIDQRSYYGRGVVDKNSFKVKNHELDQVHAAMLETQQFFNDITPYMFKEYRWNDLLDGDAQVRPIFAKGVWGGTGRLDVGYLEDQEYIFKHDGDPNLAPLFITDMYIGKRLRTTIAAKAYCQEKLQTQPQRQKNHSWCSSKIS